MAMENVTDPEHFTRRRPEERIDSSDVESEGV